MSESLPPFEGENLASYEALKTAIGLADGFTLIFAVVNTEAGAQEVMRRLWGEGVRYQKAWLRDPERPLVDQVLESVRSAKLPVMVLGLEGLTTIGEAMSRSLQNLNWTRPQWTARLPQAIVFWITADMEASLAREAPDLWRFRSLRVEFSFGLLPRQARAVELRKRLRSLELSPRIRLKSLIELFELTRDQSPLQEAVRLVGATPDLPRPQAFDYLRRLKLHGADHASVVGLGPLPRLESIELECTLYGDDEIADLIEESQPSRLRICEFREASFIGKKTLYALSKLASLTHFVWASETRRDFDGELIASLSNLKSLAIFMPEMIEHDLREICKVQSLSALSLVMVSISDEAMHCLMNLKNLWHLELIEAGLSSRNLTMISGFKELRNLYLMSNDISDRHLESLAELPRIRRIDLSGTQVTEEGVSDLRKLFTEQGRKVEVLYSRT